MISDDELLLYHYRELEAADRARIGAALAEHPALARRLHSLVARLDAAAALPEVPVPEHTQRRWQAALAGAVRGEPRAAAPRRGFFAQPLWQAAAAAVAIVAIAVTIRVVQTPPAPVADNTPRVVSPAARATPEGAAYENGLKFHLASTERRLESLGSATPEERARLIEAIVGQNRIYALAAERAGEPQLARVLRAFTPVLESVADGHDESASSIAQLSFELRVMQARLKADAASSNIL